MKTGLSDVEGGGDEIRRLIAQQRIYDTVVRYCRGIDRRDRELVLSTYHTDATDDHGVYKGDALGFVNQSVEFGWRFYDVLLHHIGNHVVDFFSDDVARSEAYVVAHHVKHGVDAQARLDLVYGRYVDRFEQRDGLWKIAHRVFVCEWSETRIIDTTWHADTRFVRGEPAPLDLVYQPLSTGYGPST